MFGNTQGGGVDEGYPDVLITPPPIPSKNAADGAMAVDQVDNVFFGGAQAHNLGTKTPQSFESVGGADSDSPRRRDRRDVGGNMPAGGDVGGNMPAGGDVGGNMPAGGDVGGNMPAGGDVGGNMPAGGDVGGNMPAGGDVGGNMPAEGDVGGNRFRRSVSAATSAPGSGVVSGTNGSVVRPVTGATTVLVGGMPATRLTSMNLQNSSNLTGARVAPSQTKVLILAK